MAMGKRRRRGRQPSMWVSSSDLPRSAGHPFYERLNRVLDAAGFDAFVEEQCAPAARRVLRCRRGRIGRVWRRAATSGQCCCLATSKGLDSERAIANRRRIRGARGKRLLRRRGERLERPNARGGRPTRRRIARDAWRSSPGLQRLAASGARRSLDARRWKPMSLRTIVRRGAAQLAAASASPRRRAPLARRSAPKKGSQRRLDASQGPGRSRR